MCDAFLVLAQTDGGHLLLPVAALDARRRAQPLPHPAAQGQARQPLQRLQRDRVPRRLGADGRRGGRGVPTIIEMVNHTRLDCVIGAATGYRAGVAQAIHHAAHRSAFGTVLIDQPLMRNVLADLCVESEAATIAAMRLARAYDEVAAGDEEAAEFRRLANAVLKYWICKRAPSHAVEASSASAATATSRSRACRASTARPAELDLGGLGQRPVPRRPARDGQEPGLGRGLLRRGRSRPPAPSPASTPTPTRCATSSPATSRDRVPRAAHRRADGDRPAGLAAGPLRRPRRRRRLLRLAPLRRLGPAFGTLPAESDFKRHHRAPLARTPS